MIASLPFMNCLAMDFSPVLWIRRNRTAARAAGIEDRHGRPVAAGEPANLCVFDPEATWTVRADAMASRSRNTPYEGREVRGKVRHTILAGEPVVIAGEAQR